MQDVLDRIIVLSLILHPLERLPVVAEEQSEFCLKGFPALLVIVLLLFLHFKRYNFNISNASPEAISLGVNWL